MEGLPPLGGMPERRLSRHDLTLENEGPDIERRLVVAICDCGSRLVATGTRRGFSYSVRALRVKPLLRQLLPALMWRSTCWRA